MGERISPDYQAGKASARTDNQGDTMYRWYCIDENGRPMKTNSTDVFDDWMNRDLHVFDTLQDQLLLGKADVQAITTL